MRTEWLILADAAQVVGGKLYVMGGGWDILNVNTGFPAQQRCAVAASFIVPWNETNQKHNVEIEIVSEDGVEMAKIAGQFEVGRPPGVPLGSEQRTQLAADMGMTFEKPGVFSIVASIEGVESTRTTFRVQPVPGSQLPGPPPPNRQERRHS
jgi:hypothetical protein